MSLKLLRYNVKEMQDEEYEEILNHLQLSEVERAKRFLKVMDAKRSTSCHFLSKKVLSLLHFEDEKEVVVKDIEYKRTKENKPIWEQMNYEKYPYLNFNISHSGDWGIISVASNMLSGIDVQETVIKSKTRNQKSSGSKSNTNKNSDAHTEEKSFRQILWEFLENMEYAFTKREYEVITGGVSSTRFRRSFVTSFASNEDLEMIRTRFFCYWTLKEAFLKSIGAGFNFGMNRAEFVFQNYEKEADFFSPYNKITLFVDGKDRTDDFFLQCFKVDESHVAAICLGNCSTEFLTPAYKKSFNKDDNDKDVMEMKRQKYLKEEIGKIEFNKVENILEFGNDSDSTEDIQNTLLGIKTEEDDFDNDYWIVKKLKNLTAKCFGFTKETKKKKEKTKTSTATAAETSTSEEESSDEDN